MTYYYSLIKIDYESDLKKKSNNFLLHATVLPSDLFAVEMTDRKNYQLQNGNKKQTRIYKI